MPPADPQAVKSCLPPVARPDARLLILGSLPGEASLRAERYYAHPRNQFWRLLETVLEEPLEPLEYQARLDVLQRRGVALWDTVATARRRGSLDADMREVARNPLKELLATLPRVEAVGFNGGTAARIGRRELGATGLHLIDLPSSSPALTMPFAAKAERWAALSAHVIDRAAARLEG